MAKKKKKNRKTGADRRARRARRRYLCVFGCRPTSTPTSPVPRETLPASSGAGRRVFKRFVAACGRRVPALTRLLFKTVCSICGGRQYTVSGRAKQKATFAVVAAAICRGDTGWQVVLTGDGPRYARRSDYRCSGHGRAVPRLQLDKITVAWRETGGRGEGVRSKSSNAPVDIARKSLFGCARYGRTALVTVVSHRRAQNVPRTRNLVCKNTKIKWEAWWRV